jgi:fatty acid desaturase
VRRSATASENVLGRRLAPASAPAGARAIAREETPEGSGAEAREADYAELKRRIVAAGLLEKQVGYYAANVAIRLSLLGASVAILVLVENFWLQLANAAFLAFAFTQVGFLGHDAGHRQIFAGAARNDWFGLLPNLLLGVSRSWWIDTHNQHHINPNDLELDPHTALPIFAFSEEQARSKRGWLRTLVGYQSAYFFPVLFLEGVGVRAASAQYLLRTEAKGRLLEALLIAVHVAGYAALVFYALSVWQAVTFIAVHQGLFGLYMGSVFAPNHKGMLVLDAESKLDFVRRQVLTSRDVRAHPLTDFWYGGLNYQIEHHLFPSMARNKLSEAQVIVRAFCEERGIPYRESGAMESHREIVSYLHEVSAPCRAASA